MKSQLDKVAEARSRALKIQTNLANQYEIDNNNLLKETKYNIAPVPVDDKMTPQEKLQNNTLQIQLLRKALKEIMVDTEIWKYTTKYVSGDAGFINTHFEEMKTLLKDRKYITADFFRNFVVAFKTNYAETRTIDDIDNKDILDVGLEVKYMTETMKEDLSKTIQENIIESRALPEAREILSNAYLGAFPNDIKTNIAKNIAAYTDDPTKITRIMNAVRFAEAIDIQDANLLNMLLFHIDRINDMQRQNKINREDGLRFEKSVIRQIQAINDKKITPAEFKEPQISTPARLLLNAPFKQLDTQEFASMLAGNENLFQEYLETRAGGVLNLQQIKNAIENYGVVGNLEYYLQNIIGGVYKSALEAEVDNVKANLTKLGINAFKMKINRVIKNFREKPKPPLTILDSFNILNTGFDTVQADLGKALSVAKIPIQLSSPRPSGKKGSGMIQKQLKSARVRIGGGIERQGRPLYQKLGRYIIHIPSLTKNVLNVKYPSMVSIKSLPKRPISTMMKNLLFEMLDNEDFNKKYYNVLDEDEQDSIRDVLYQAEIGEKFGFGLKDTPYSSIIDRFNMLKSQVIAGNNNKELITELKQLTSKLVDKSILNKGDGYELLKLIDAI